MGESSFWYRPTRVVPDQRPLNGRRCCCCCFYPMLVPSVLWRCWLGGRKGIRPVKTEWWGVGMAIYLSGARCDLHMAKLMPLPLTVPCFNKIQIGFAFLVLAHPGSPGQRAVKMCVCVCVCVCVCACVRVRVRARACVFVFIPCHCYLFWQHRKEQRLNVSEFFSRYFSDILRSL